MAVVRCDRSSCAMAHAPRTMPNRLMPERYPHRCVIRLNNHDSGIHKSTRLVTRAYLNGRSARSFSRKNADAAATVNGPPKKMVLHDVSTPGLGSGASNAEVA